MANDTFNQLPATLDISLIKGDEFACDLDFSIDVTNYVWTAIIFSTTRIVNSNYPGGINSQGDTEETFNVNVTDAANGQLTISLQETQTEALSEAETYRWLLRAVSPGNVTRTYISGSFTVRSP